MENQEALQARAIANQFPNTVHRGIYHIMSNGVMSTGIVVGGILFPTQHLAGVEQLLIHPSSNLICLEIRKFPLLEAPKNYFHN